MTGGILTQSVVGRPLAGPSTSSMDVTTYRIESRYNVGRCGKTCLRGKSRGCGRTPRLGLHSSLTSAWEDSRLCSKVVLQLVPNVVRGDGHGLRGPVVGGDIGGQYEESFEDVSKHLLDYFTYKAVRTVLAQLSEMNPHQYAWFYNFVVNNKPQDSKLFIRLLVKERQELGERVMVTRLHLFNKWVKKYNHAQLHKAISDQNLELLRERLIQTVKFTNTIGDDIETTPPPP